MDINISINLGDALGGEGLLGPIDDKPIITVKNKKKRRKKKKSLLMQSIESSLPIKSEYETVTV